MRLSELAFASYLYTYISDYDNSYNDLLAATGNSPDLNIPEHRDALLVWLRLWGCRQFATNYNNLSSENMLTWFNQSNDNLPVSNRNLWELTDRELAIAGNLYESLSNVIASYRTRNGNRYPVTIGPTGASKLLFAIRPRTFILWDDPIRERLNHDGSRDSYVAFLLSIKTICLDLSKQCENYHFQISDLPRRLNRPLSTVPKLLDEYYWVTITNGIPVPNPELLSEWANWNRV